MEWITMILEICIMEAHYVVVQVLKLVLLLSVN